MIKQDVYDEVQGLEPLCQEICHTLWNHPELSGNERESANFLRKILSEEGFTIENNEHLEHAFIAEYGKGKPVIAILGEYDALPGLSQKADIKKEGKDVTLVSFGKILKLAIQAAADLEKEGISVEVIDLRTVRPLDYEAILTSVKKTNRLVVLEEAWPFGSVASEITYMVQQKAFDYLDAPIKRITTPDAPAPYSAVLFAEWFPKLEKVKEEIKNAMYVKS